jgi:ribonuclease HI
MKDLTTLNYSNSLFTVSPNYTNQLKPPPPWADPSYKSLWFPMKKAEASANPQKARATFNSLITHISPTAIIGYTDGSVNNDATSCALTFPSLQIEQAWHLSQGSNIQSAELHGVHKALEVCYHLDSTPEELYIFCDSKAALQAIDATTKLTQTPILLDIWNLLLALKASGTQTYLAWIPSHIGITGNDLADRLESNMDKIPLLNSIRNILTPNEVIALYKMKWSTSTLNCLKLQHGLLCWSRVLNNHVLCTCNLFIEQHIQVSTAYLQPLTVYPSLSSDIESSHTTHSNRDRDRVVLNSQIGLCNQHSLAISPTCFWSTFL